MESGKYYVIAEGNNLFESMTKEQILAAITQAVESHEISDVDTGFVTTLKELNRGAPVKWWVGTTAEYNAIATPETNCFYVLSDDTELEDIEELVSTLQTSVGNLSDTVIELSDTVSDLSNETSTLSTTLNGITALKGKVILNSTVAYGDSLSVSLADDITKYTEVIVTGQSVMGDVLCSVSQPSSTVVKIKGVATANNSSSNSTVIVCINLSVNKATNKLTVNNSTSIMFLGQTQGTISEISINKIVGVY